MMQRHIVTINIGSSSVKIHVYDPHADNRTPIAHCIIRSAGTQTHVSCILPDQTVDTHSPSSYDAASGVLLGLEYLSNLMPGVPFAGWIEAIGIRIVHGGGVFHNSTLLSDNVIRQLTHIQQLAPLHNIPVMHAIVRIWDRIGTTIPLVGVFDTAFFDSLPDHTRIYPIPYAITEKYNIRRFGFHGLAHESLLDMYAEYSQKPRHGCSIITLQLGSGSSIAAIQNGKPIDTSMGFTPLEGLMMRTRSGDIDPGILFYLARETHMKIEEIHDMLEHNSGLSGVSDTDGSIENLLGDHKNDLRAKLAVTMYTYRIQKYIGSYLAILPGIQALVIGGGIAEHNPNIIHTICSGLTHVGISPISVRKFDTQTPSHTISVHIFPTREENLIYSQTCRALRTSSNET